MTVQWSEVLAYEVQLVQVVIELISNAAAAFPADLSALPPPAANPEPLPGDRPMPVYARVERDAAPPSPRGTITVSIGAGTAGHVRLSVSDDGVGMTAEVLKRAFEPFFTTRGIGAGRGLGLSIADSLVSAHRGQLTAESEPGRGSTFRFELPLAPPTSA